VHHREVYRVPAEERARKGERERERERHTHTCMHSGCETPTPKIPSRRLLRWKKRLSHLRARLSLYNGIRSGKEARGNVFIPAFLRHWRINASPCVDRGTRNRSNISAARHRRKNTQHSARRFASDPRMPSERIAAIVIPGDQRAKSSSHVSAILYVLGARSIAECAFICIFLAVGVLAS